MKCLWKPCSPDSSCILAVCYSAPPQSAIMNTAAGCSYSCKEASCVWVFMRVTLHQGLVSMSVHQRHCNTSFPTGGDEECVLKWRSERSLYIEGKKGVAEDGWEKASNGLLVTGGGRLKEKLCVHLCLVHSKLYIHVASKKPYFYFYVCSQAAAWLLLPIPLRRNCLQNPKITPIKFSLNSFSWHTIRISEYDISSFCI